jgi:hypothetical protein
MATRSRSSKTSEPGRERFRNADGRRRRSPRSRRVAPQPVKVATPHESLQRARAAPSSARTLSSSRIRHRSPANPDSQEFMAVISRRHPLLDSGRVRGGSAPGAGRMTPKNREVDRGESLGFGPEPPVVPAGFVARALRRGGNQRTRRGTSSTRLSPARRSRRTASRSASRRRARPPGRIESRARVVRWSPRATMKS